MLKFHRYFRDNAIIQYGKKICIKGYSDSDVTIKLFGGDVSYIQTAKVIDKKFKVFFNPIKDTKSVFKLVAINKEESISINVKFGNVYLALGQSNMSYTLASCENVKFWVDKVKNNDIAILNLEEKPFKTQDEILRPYYPQDDLLQEYSWITGNNEQISNNSAICVQTASMLYEKTKIPTAFIHTAMGGLTVESYLPREVVEQDKKFADKLAFFGRYNDKTNWNNMGIRNFAQVSGVWNEKIAPLFDFNFNGVVWYLGESAAWHYELAVCFKKSLGLLVDTIRKYFGPLPFVFIDIAPEYYAYGDNYGYLYINEAMFDVAKRKKDVCNIPIYDIEPRWLKPDGDEFFHPIHTTNKEPVSKRVYDALIGETKSYPFISSVKQVDSRLIAKIGGIKTKLQGGLKNGFTVAGENGKYYPAIAKVVSKDEIEIYSQDVDRPTKCTYAFMQYQDFCNVQTTDGLPLTPYRSERVAVNDKYCFTPSFIVKGADKVYENNFGHNVGFCRKIDVFTSGKIYRADKVKISIRKEDIKISAKPKYVDYKYFGVSPEINLCGHKNHLDKFNYLTFSLYAEKSCRFCGVVIKLADSNIFRYNLLMGNDKYNEVELTGEKSFFAVDLNNAIRGDSSDIALTKTQKSSIVELEFYFRSNDSVNVYLGDLLLTDINTTKSLKIEKKEETNGRTDIQLPQN